MHFTYKSGRIVTDEELKECLLELMDYIHEFCKDNNINYFMLGGTMLGAVRHKGFIPWDDDIDIGMLREDYARFCMSFPTNHDNFQLKCIDSDNRYYLPFAKVIDTRISLYEEVPNAPEIGAYVDIFPLDYVKKDSKGRCKYHTQKLRNAIEDLCYMKLRKDRKVWKNLAIVISRILCPYSLHKLACLREKRAISSSYEEKTEWIANLHGAWKEREVMSSDYFGKGMEYEFEGRTYCGLTDSHSYLSCLYGDYMTPPPPEKRITHHRFIAKWK